MSITFRDMQNPDEPNLPFAQELEYPISPHANYPINFGFNQSLSLASLSKGRQTYYDYMVKGDRPFPFGLGKIDGVKRLTESNAENYRRMGYSVVKVEGTGGTLVPKPKPQMPPTTTGGLSKSEVEKIIESYHGDDISRLYRIHEEQEGRITAKSGGFTKPQIEKIFIDYYGDDIEMLHKGHVTQQDYFDKKIEAQIKEHAGFHKKFSDLGKSVTDVSSGLEAHKFGHGNGNGCDCDFWDIGCKAKCGIEGLIPYILIGGVALLAIRKRK